MEPIIYHITCCMGKTDNNSLPFLTPKQVEEFNLIGYSGKDSKGNPNSYQEYLNSLNIGQFSVDQTMFADESFIEKFTIARVPKTPIKTATISISDIKEHGWAGLVTELGYSTEDASDIFQYGEYANITIVVDENLNIVGGKIHPFKSSVI